MRYCPGCGAKLERKRFPNGDLECLMRFNRRRYCDRACMMAAFNRKAVTPNS